MFNTILKESTSKKWAKFERIRGKESEEVFWDAVVLSVMDQAQKEVFELQIEEKLTRNELPLSATYHVFHDPVGVKVGNGGGVISVIDELDKIYGSKLKELKVVIFLSGGYSQRMPSASAFGKIFSALPFGDPVHQMLEAKLAMFVDIPRRMNAGVFVASCDTFELFHLSDDDDWNFKRSGFTALAHCSPIDVGVTHGVFVVKDENRSINGLSSSVVIKSKMASCSRFLHKPSKELMRKNGAVFVMDNKEYIYSDSAYYMDMKTSMLLLQWYKKYRPIKCEIDAYGDFLQALGSDSTDAYCSNVNNVTMLDKDLISTRIHIYNVLQGTQLNVVILGESKFYHIGTTKEYIYHFCEDENFREELSCSSYVMVKSTSPLIEKQNHVIIHSYVPDASSISKNVVVEYSFLNKENIIGENCIVSNCSFPEGIVIPGDLLVHTIPIINCGSTLYVTIVFGIADNLKTSCGERSEAGTLKLCGKPLSEVMDISSKVFADDCSILNLWNARLFSAYSTPEISLRESVKLVARSSSCSPLSFDNNLYSITDILKLKDLKTMLQMRNNLRRCIIE